NIITAHKCVALTMVRAILQHDGSVMVTCESGIGKTTMCRGFVEQLDRRTLTSFVVEPFVSLENLLKTVLIEFGVISRSDLSRGFLMEASRHDLTAAVREFLASLAVIQASAVLILDDAQK